jgi:hypothetical protein
MSCASRRISRESLVSYMIKSKAMERVWKHEPATRTLADLGEEDLEFAARGSADLEAWRVWLMPDLLEGRSWERASFRGPWDAAVRMVELRPRTPVNLEARLERLEGSVLTLSEALLSRPVVFTTSIVDLNSIQHSLKCPIPVVMEEYSDEAVATFPEVETRGWGGTPAEALNDLKEQVILLYEELVAAHPDELGKLPTAWLRVLEHYVAKGEEAH